jgi:hypothetical protein
MAMKPLCSKSIQEFFGTREKWVNKYQGLPPWKQEVKNSTNNYRAK